MKYDCKPNGNEWTSSIPMFEWWIKGNGFNVMERTLTLIWHDDAHSVPPYTWWWRNIRYFYIYGYEIKKKKRFSNLVYPVLASRDASPSSSTKWNPMQAVRCTALVTRFRNVRTIHCFLSLGSFDMLICHSQRTLISAEVMSRQNASLVKYSDVLLYSR